MTPTPKLLDEATIKRLQWDKQGHFWWDAETGHDWSPLEVLLEHATALSRLEAGHARQRAEDDGNRVIGNLEEALGIEIGLRQQAEKLAAEQAEDDGLWFQAQTAPEAYLQQALRKLHATIEGEALMLAALAPGETKESAP